MRERLDISANLTRISTLGTYTASGAVSTTVADSTIIAAGSVVENATTGEQMLVATSAGAAPGIITVLAEGRGYRGSTAAAGSANDTIYIDPKHTTSNIKAAINVAYNDWLSRLMPRLVWDITTAGNFSTTANIFACPAAAMTLERVVYQADATITDYTDITHLAGAMLIQPTGLITTGKGFRLRAQPGTTSQAIWQLNGLRWTYLEAAGDTVPADFPGDGVDLIIDGAALYLLGWHNMPRFTTTESVTHRDNGNDIELTALSIKAREWARRASEVASSYSSLARGHFPSRRWVS